MQTNQVNFNNFFANPDDDLKDIYNDSSGTGNNSNANNSTTAINLK